MKTTFQPIHFDNLKVEHHISHLITLNEINGHPQIDVGDTSRFGNQKLDEKIVEWLDIYLKIGLIILSQYASSLIQVVLNLQQYKTIFSRIVSLLGIADSFVPMFNFVMEIQIITLLLDDESIFKKMIYPNIKDNNQW